MILVRQLLHLLMQSNLSKFIIGALVLLAIGFYLGKNYSGNNTNAGTTSGTPSSPVNTTPANTTTQQPTYPQHEDQPVAGVPQKALDVLQYVRAHGQPMDGYVGGRIFGNYEHRLPETDDNGNPMHYQEWDVNPKVDGQNRGTQRLITSSNGRAWYTGDHYNTFTEIK